MSDSNFCSEAHVGSTIHVDLTKAISEILEKNKTGLEFLQELEEYRIGVKGGRRYCYELEISDVLFYVYGRNDDGPEIQNDVFLQFQEVSEHDIWVKAVVVVIPFLNSIEME